MVLDFIIAAAIGIVGFRGWNHGFAHQAWRLATLVGAAVMAKIVSFPTGLFLSPPLRWTASFAVGVSFLVYLTIFYIVIRFILGKATHAFGFYARGGDLKDKLFGALAGTTKAVIFTYVALCCVMLLTRTLGAGRPTLAIQYQNSHVGRYLLVRNVLDPEPFPHAAALQSVIPGSSLAQSGEAAKAIERIRNLDSMAFFDSDNGALLYALDRGDFKSLIADGRILKVITDPDFLAAAKVLERPTDPTNDALD
jgi:uncharacterized membrane protein required for colicin V production